MNATQVSEIALIADTSGLYALYDADDGAHEEMTAAYDTEPTTLIVPVLVAVEVDYLITKRRLGHTDGLIESLHDILEGEARLRAALVDGEVVRAENPAQMLHDLILVDVPATM